MNRMPIQPVPSGVLGAVSETVHQQREQPPGPLIPVLPVRHQPDPAHHPQNILRLDVRADAAGLLGGVEQHRDRTDHLRRASA